MKHQFFSKEDSPADSKKSLPGAYEVARTQQLLAKIVARSGLSQGQARQLWEALWQAVQYQRRYLQQIQQWLQRQRMGLIEWLRHLKSSQKLSRNEWVSLGLATGLMISQATLPALVQADNPLGSEFQVNTHTTDTQRASSVAIDSNGDFVVVWQSGTFSGTPQDGSRDGVYGQRYNASGETQGSEFQINTYTTDTQRNPGVAMDGDGDFVVVWESRQDGSGYGIYAQRYNASGETQGSEFKVNTYTTNNQSNPTVGMDSDGDFVVAWTSGDQDGGSNGVYAQRYNATGETQGSEFKVNTHTTDRQFAPTVGMDSDGDFVVAWTSGDQDGSSYGIYAQRYNASGETQGSEFKINTHTTDIQFQPSVGMDNDGNFVVAWTSKNQDGGTGGSFYGIYAQRYNASGTAQGSEFQVNSYITHDQMRSTVGMDSDGDFFVAWDSYIQDGSYPGIYAQRYNANGAVQGSEFKVNTYTTGHQRAPDVAMDSDGDFVVAWQSNSYSGTGQDGSLTGIYAQRYYSIKSNYLPVIIKS